MRPTICSIPAEAVLAFETAGAEWAHLVDLDGARAGGPRQHGMLADIALSVSLKLQVAGGFREEAHFTRMFDAGVDRVVIGSLAVKDPDRTRALFARFGGERLCLALDVKLVEGTPMVATSGWTETSQLSLWDAARMYPEARHLLVTDIGRDGMMAGPNLDLIDEIVRCLPNLASRPPAACPRSRTCARSRARARPERSSARRCGSRRIDLKDAIDAGA
jgi:phosphoribosylformimino-5-aminoimidazole carboxamide ribotide isomerase